MRTWLLRGMTLSAAREGGSLSAPPRPMGNSPAPIPRRPRPLLLRCDPPPASRLRSPSLGRGDADATASGPRDLGTSDPSGRRAGKH